MSRQGLCERVRATTKSCPQPASGRERKRGLTSITLVNERGDQAMGFSYLKTTHHFRLSADGGAIEVNGDSGSPRVTGSTNFSRASTSSRYSSVLHLRPPPGRRNRTVTAILGCAARAANLAWPLRIVVGDNPVAWATA